MPSFNIDAMRQYLSRSYSSVNRNKINGMLAEIDFRRHIADLGYADRISVGGWIVRSDGPNNFAHNTIVFFPETIHCGQEYPLNTPPSTPPNGLHTICATFHQLGIHSFFLSPSIAADNDHTALTWRAIQLGIPGSPPWFNFPENMNGFRERSRAYNYLRYNSIIPEEIPIVSLEEEFSKEHARITFNNRYTAEVSDIDGILWGESNTYPIEIKEKTVGNDNKIGPFFGLDVGPFVKLAFYAARRQGNLNSLFIVREIADTDTRQLINWHYIKFETLAKYASWIPKGGGQNMRGGNSTTVQIPLDAFNVLDRAALERL